MIKLIRPPQFDSLANAPGLDALNPRADGLDIPEGQEQGLDIFGYTVFDLRAGPLPNLIQPKSSPNVLINPTARLGSRAGTVSVMFDLMNDYQINFKRVSFACAFIAVGDSVPLDCTMAFQRDYDGKILEFSSPGDGSMVEVDLSKFSQANSMTPMITDLGLVGNILSTARSRFAIILDDLSYEIVPKTPSA
jgi:hypothetical protein